jgi:hypothetical protein
MEISAHSVTQSGIARQGGGTQNGARPADEQRELDKLKERDREVRAHEAAHMAAAGGHAKGGASFSYTRGPDGRLYASGGEVSIDTSAVPNDPRATLQKAQTIQRAALAPAEPSGQDRQVAAAAAAMAAEAQREIAGQGGEASPDSGQTDAAASLQERIRSAGGSAANNDAALHLIA